MIKVLNVTHWYPTPEHPVSGSFIVDQCHAIQQNGSVESHLLFFDLLSGKGLWPKLENNELPDDSGINVRVLKLNWIFSPLLFMFPQLQWLFFGKKIRRMVLQIKPDIIHGHVVHPSGGIAYRIAREFRLPLVLSEHWSNLKSYFRLKLQSAWGKLAYQQAGFIFPVSGFLKRMIIETSNDLDEQKIVVIPNVVDSGIFFFKKSDVSNEEYRFIMVSHWTRHKQVTKRPELVFEALNLFAKESDKRIKLTIVGSGNILDELKSKAESVDFDVTFSGSLNKEEIAKSLHEHDYFLHASNIETFSVVTAEALMCGLPSVVSDAGALPELVTVNRGVVTDNSIAGWVNAIRKITTTDYNRSEFSQEVAGICAASGIGRRITEAYRAALEKHSATINS